MATWTVIANGRLWADLREFGSRRLCVDGRPGGTLRSLLYCLVDCLDCLPNCLPNYPSCLPNSSRMHRPARARLSDERAARHRARALCDADGRRLRQGRRCRLLHHPLHRPLHGIAAAPSACRFERVHAQVFQIFDRDHTGGLDPFEFRATIALLGDHSTEAEVRDLASGFPRDPPEILLRFPCDSPEIRRRFTQCSDESSLEIPLAGARALFGGRRRQRRRAGRGRVHAAAQGDLAQGALALGRSEHAAGHRQRTPAGAAHHCLDQRRRPAPRRRDDAGGCLTLTTPDCLTPTTRPPSTASLPPALHPNLPALAESERRVERVHAHRSCSSARARAARRTFSTRCPPRSRRIPFRVPPDLPTIGALPSELPPQPSAAEARRAEHYHYHRCSPTSCQRARPSPSASVASLPTSATTLSPSRSSTSPATRATRHSVRSHSPAPSFAQLPLPTTPPFPQLPLPTAPPFPDVALMRSARRAGRVPVHALVLDDAAISFITAERRLPSRLFTASPPDLIHRHALLLDDALPDAHVRRDLVRVLRRAAAAAR